MSSPSQETEQTLIEAAIRLGNKEFIKGFLSGQLILILLLFFLVKVFLLRNSDETKQELKRRRQFTFKPSNQQLSSQRSVQTSILSKLNYEASNHPFESCDWLSIFVAQILQHYRQDASFKNALLERLDLILNADQRPDFLGPIIITDLQFGEEFMIFKNARIRLSELSQLAKLYVDVSFEDQLSVGIETQVMVNWPQPTVAALPISLTLSLERFAGTMCIELLGDANQSSSSSDNNSLSSSNSSASSAKGHIAISFLDDFILDMEIKSLLGHRTKVKDLPKLRQVLLSRIRAGFIDTIVSPNARIIPLFRLPTTPLSSTGEMDESDLPHGGDVNESIDQTSNIIENNTIHHLHQD